MDDGRIWITEDDGQTWAERSEGLANRYIRSIVSSRYDFETVYACMTGLNDDDMQAYIYKSDDLGQNWSSIKGNLPNQPVNVIVEDPWHTAVLYAGTHRGIFCSMDQGANWMVLGDDMPFVSVAFVTCFIT